MLRNVIALGSPTTLYAVLAQSVKLKRLRNNLSKRFQPQRWLWQVKLYCETMKGYLFKTSQLFEDLKTTGIVLRCAWRFDMVAAAAGAIISVVVSQPGTVGTVRVFEAHNIAILYGSAINSVPGEDLEGEPVVW